MAWNGSGICGSVDLERSRRFPKMPTRKPPEAAFLHMINVPGSHNQGVSSSYSLVSSVPETPLDSVAIRTT